MRRTRTLLAAVASLGALSLFAAAAPAHAAWQQLGCAPTDVRYARICFDRSTTDSSQARGRYINNSGYDLETSGFFYKQTTSQTIACASTVTKSGTTSTCTRTLPKGRWQLGAYTFYGGQYLGVATTDQFNFGF
jgi:uncharacterized heparinase superfamily protein